ncbi:1763_t:CDS:10, partial [Racocetra persica]
EESTEECEANARTTFSLDLAEESTKDFEECEDNSRTTFSLGLGYEDKVGPALSLLESNNCVDSSLEVSEDIHEPLGLELGIVKDNSCMGLKVSEVNTGSTFGLELELEDGMDLEASENNSGPVLGLELGLAKNKGGLGLEVRENSKSLVKSNGSVNLNLELAESRSSVASDFGLDSVYSLSFKKDNITELYIGLQFESWKAAEYYIKEYRRKKGFAVKKYRIQFSADQLYINLSKHENNDDIYMTFVKLVYNHELIADNSKFATTFQKFDQAIMLEIKRAVIYGHCDVYTIRNLLQPLFPDQLFLTQDLLNTIQKIKHKKNIAGSDASQLLKYLLENPKKEPMIFIQPLINMDSDRLYGIFWMTENQIMLWTRYSDVILHDNTSRTNKYNYPLLLFILVDNDGKSQLGAQAFINNEIQESYE